MPFARISAVEGWKDFGFKFKEGNNETAWDDEHDIITFRYTEPMTWWMRMPKDMPRTMDAALVEAKRLADSGNRKAQVLFTSGFHDADGKFPARLRDTPWCDGAVWSINSMPGITGEVTDFQDQVETLILSADSTVRSVRLILMANMLIRSKVMLLMSLITGGDHFSAAETPLVFAPGTLKPAIFRGLVTFEYVRKIASDMHAREKYMMG